MILEQVPVYKYLGVLIDDALNFKMHVRGVIKNVGHNVAMLGKIRPKLTEKAATMVFKGMILPLFDNGDTFFIATNKSLLDRLDVLQNRAIRTIFRMSRRDNTQKAMEKLRVTPLNQQRLLHLMQLTKWIKEVGTLVDKRQLPTRAHSENRCNLLIMKPRTTLYQKSFLHTGCTIWNTLPSDAHILKDPDKYKKCIKELINQNKLTFR